MAQDLTSDSHVGNDESFLSSDQPIRVRDEDLLGRLPLVQLLKEEILSAPTRDGFVMALTAPWGEGKTSVLNLVADVLGDEVTVVRFNPWLFTDAQALVIRFFNELSAQVRGDQRLRKVGRRLATYGQAVAPVGSLVAGPAASVIAQSLGAVVASEPRGVSEERQALRRELDQKGQRILVLIDDIDRLHDEEIQDVMRLVKHVGDLPFVTYLLAFDRPYVEKALSKEQFDGRSYLEKVVQVTYDLPAIRPAELQNLLWGRLNSVLAPLDHLPVREERWAELFAQGVAPFFSNLRDVARYVSGVPARVRLVGKEVALEDILALEALRVFEPGVHQELPGLVEALTQRRSALFVDPKSEEEKDKLLLEKAVGRASPARQSKVKELLATLFPRAANLLGGSAYQSTAWRANRQVADASAFRAYLHATIDPGAASYAMLTETLEAFGNTETLRALLGDADASVLQDIFQRLPDFRDRIDPASAAAGAGELLRFQSRLPVKEEVFQPSPASYMKRAVQAILEAVPEIAERQRIVEGLYDNADSNSARLWLLDWFGTFPQRERERPDEEMLGEEATLRLGEDLRRRVRAREAEEIAAEELFVRLVLHGFGDDDDGRRELEGIADDALTLALLRACVGLSLDDGRVFNLKTAERIFTRQFLARRIEELREIQGLNSEEGEALDLAQAALEVEPMAAPSEDEEQAPK